MGWPVNLAFSASTMIIAIPTGLKVFNWVATIWKGSVRMTVPNLFLVFRNGVSEPPVPGKLVDPATARAEYETLLKTDRVLFWPTAAWRDVLFSSGLVLLAYWLGPPAVTVPPNPSIVPADSIPDWYLTWYFTVLALWPYGITNAMLILVLLMAVVALIAVPFIRNRGERHPAR